eukprot:6197227-Pleurochrysis_carterae.AAC.2
MPGPASGIEDGAEDEMGGGNDVAAVGADKRGCCGCCGCCCGAVVPSTSALYCLIFESAVGIWEPRKAEMGLGARLDLRGRTARDLAETEPCAGSEQPNPATSAGVHAARISVLEQAAIAPFALLLFASAR